MKKIVGVALATILAFSMLGLLAACGKGANDIESVTVGHQESSGVTMNNYEVRLKDSTAWSSLSDSDREKIAKEGFSQAQDKIKEDGVRNYNIIGITAEGSVAFQFDREHSLLLIYVDNVKTTEVAVETPEL